MFSVLASNGTMTVKQKIIYRGRGAPWKVVTDVPRFLPRTAYAKISERLTRPREKAKSTP